MRYRDRTSVHRFADLHGLSLKHEGEGSRSLYVVKTDPETGDLLPPDRVAIVFTKRSPEEEGCYIIVDRFALYQFGLDVVQRATYECLED